MPKSDRVREVQFALLLLLPAGLAIAAAEVLLRQRQARIATADIDWSEMRDAAGVRTADGLIRFRAGARYRAVRFNRFGLRGPDVPVPAPAGTVRIAFVGDSKLLAADQAEETTLPARTVVALARRYPGCRFDYVNVSGPGYNPAELARLWSLTAVNVKPSVAVILTGSATDLVAPQGNTHSADNAGLIRHSALLRFLRRELLMLSPVSPSSAAAAAPPHELAARYHTLLAPLRAAIGKVPAIAIAYRSRVSRPLGLGGLRLDAPLLEARHLRQQVPGLGLAQARTVSALVVEGMRREAAAAGWRFIDPLAAIQSDPASFIDRSHFSSAGNARLASAVTDSLARQVTPDCRILQDTNSVRAHFKQG